MRPSLMSHFTFLRGILKDRVLQKHRKLKHLSFRKVNCEGKIYWYYAEKKNHKYREIKFKICKTKMSESVMNYSFVFLIIFTRRHLSQISSLQWNNNRYLHCWGLTFQIKLIFSGYWSAAVFEGSLQDS